MKPNFEMWALLTSMLNLFFPFFEPDKTIRFYIFKENDYLTFNIMKKKKLN